MVKRKVTRKVDRKMHDFGDCDLDKRKIRVNPRHGGLLNTIIHEELHIKYPDKPESWISKKAKREESKLTIPEAIKLLTKYKYGN